MTEISERTKEELAFEVERYATFEDETSDDALAVKKLIDVKNALLGRIEERLEFNGDSGSRLPTPIYAKANKGKDADASTSA